MHSGGLRARMHACITNTIALRSVIFPVTRPRTRDAVEREKGVRDTDKGAFAPAPLPLFFAAAALTGSLIFEKGVKPSWRFEVDR